MGTIKTSKYFHISQIQQSRNHRDNKRVFSEPETREDESEQRTNSSSLIPSSSPLLVYMCVERTARRPVPRALYPFRPPVGFVSGTLVKGVRHTHPKKEEESVDSEKGRGKGIVNAVARGGGGRVQGRVNRDGLVGASDRARSGGRSYGATVCRARS